MSEQAKDPRKDIPKANAEGDKLPEEDTQENVDPMNQSNTGNKQKDVPKATAEGDKLPEEDD